jgi:hypothetical protein
MPTIKLSLAAKLIVWAIVSILFAATYKNDATIFAESRWLSTYVQPFYVLFLKRISIGVILICPIAAAVMIISGPRLGNPMGIAGLCLTLLFLFEIFRMSVSQNPYGLQILAGGTLFATFYLMAMCGQGTRHPGEMPYAVVLGIAMFSLGHVAINLSMLLAGLGFHNSRFLGTSVQPNFIGVQMAVAAIFLLGWVPQSLTVNIFRWVGVVSAIILLVLSGSRTGLVLFAAGSCAYFSIAGVRLRYIGPTIFIGLIVVIALVAFNPPDLDLSQYDRGGADTRQAAWQTMFDAVNSAPFFGAGELPLASESSYLRGWAAVGLLFPITFLIVLITMCVKTAQVLLHGANDRVFATLAACIFGCLVAGLLEGFLIDTFSFTLFAFLFALTGFEGAAKVQPVAVSPAPLSS